MIPTLGRIVHYTNLGDADGKYPPEQQAAIITGVKARMEPPAACGGQCEEHRFVVDLHVFYRTGQFDMQDVPFSPEFSRGHWTWPPVKPVPAKA